jgi:hypothetical protein
MSRESGGEQPQKTVAELLAQHGGQVGGTPRRRRRRAEDDGPDIGDTAPQAIIDRVQGDSATPEAPARHNGRSRDEHEEPQPPRRRPHAMPAQEESGPPTRRSMPPRRQAPPGPHQQPESYGRGPEPRHVPPPAPPQSKPPQSQPPQQSQPLPVQPPQVPQPPQRGSLPSRLDGSPEHEVPEAPPQQSQAPQQPQQSPRAPQMGSGGYPVPQAESPRLRRRPLRRPAPPPPEPEPHTEQFPAITDETSKPDEPPAGLTGWRRRRDKTQTDDTEVGGMPPVPGPAPDAPGAGPPTGAFTPSFDTGDQPAVDDRNEHGDLNGYDGYDHGPSFGAFDDDPLHQGGLRAGAVDELDGEARDGHGDLDEYGYDDEPLGDETHDDADDLDERDPDDEPGPEPSPAKQWMTLGAQLALGAVGGAAVWLGFNWLWVKLPAAALVAALAVTVGLVLIVRKVRRAEDLQTTVLALLVGLVVTVSPAALLLVSQ